MKNPLIHLGIAFALLVASLGAYWFAFYSLTAKSARNTELLSVIATSRGAIDQNADAVRRLAQVAGVRDAVRSYFVSSNDAVAYLESLESAGKSLGATVSVVSVKEEVTPRARLDIALKIEGTFAAVMRTVGVIEHGPHDIQVSALTLGEGRTEEDKEIWTATMTMSVGMVKVATSTTP